MNNNNTKSKLKLVVTKHWEEEGKIINTGKTAYREKINKSEEVTFTGNSIHELFMQYCDLARRYQYCNDVRIELKKEDKLIYNDWYDSLSPKDLHYISYGNSTVD